MFEEFKKFIAQGNVVDLAIGVVMGSAFTAIVNSLVEDLITPLIGIVLGNIDLSGYEVEALGATFGIGNFVNAIISFLLIALVLFFIVKGINKVEDVAGKGEDTMMEEEADAEPDTDALLVEIRDLLKEQNMKANTMEHAMMDGSMQSDNMESSMQSDSMNEMHDDAMKDNNMDDSMNDDSMKEDKMDDPMK